MKNVFKKSLFSLGAIGLVSVGCIGVTNAQLIEQDTQYNPNNSTELKNDQLIITVKNFVNWILGLLSLIALCICLRGGFQMLTASGDENKYKKGFTVLKQAGIGLAIIGLAWLIVSIVFWIINKTTTGV